MNFSLLDDVVFDASELPADELRGVLFEDSITAIGPLVEYVYLRRNNKVLPAITDSVQSPVVDALRQTLSCASFDRMPTDTSSRGRDVEFHWVPLANEAVVSPKWVGYRKRLQDAAEQSGYPKKVAQGFAGAFDEMIANVLEHSQNPRSAVVGYRCSSQEFEYVIADAGEGVLASLHRHPDYQRIDDSGSALRVALTDGESRFGRGSGRGHGFRQIFLSLASLGGYLRFRSGDHRLEIDGTSPSVATARIGQTALYQGFFACVLCRRRVPLAAKPPVAPVTVMRRVESVAG